MEYTLLEALSLAAALATILVSILITIIRYKVDFPQLPMRYGGFRGRKTKIFVVDVAIVTNGEAGYAKQIMNGFINRAVTVFGKTEYALRFHDHMGFPRKEDDDRNRELIAGLLEDKPDVLVTIGSMVSKSAMDHFSDIVPILAIGIGAPVRTGLVEDEDKLSLEGRNIATVRYGVRLERRIDFLARLFDATKRTLRFVFVYHSGVPQDEILAKDVKRISEEREDIDLSLLETTSDRLPSAYDATGVVVFGFYHLNEQFDSFLKHAERAVFLGLNPSDTKAGAIASTGNNDYKLGELAVDRLLVPHLIRGKLFSQLSLVEPKEYYTINMQVAQRRGLAFSRYAKRLASEIINPRA